ncbi:protein 5NUC-like [Odontomachus brunneus]|uniref:protein 5NUC-like n=1 Tax=Odontomachus brunneus TaxID=486640 RepID=UPI0013F29020|nr:protein 5NUC-like [Odontomachus brunneus]
MSIGPIKWYILALLAFVNGVLANPVVKQDDDFTITIVHTNDMHARFEETSQLSTACTPKDSKEGKCYGGFARIATLIRQARAQGPTIFLNAGDTFQGTAWYNVYKWVAPAVFLTFLEPDAISLGNHEFDDGIQGLIPFIQNVTFPIVTSNLDLSMQPDLRDTKLKKSTILEVNGRKIGVIGYLTPETKILSTTENVIFKDEVESIQKEAKKLKAQGIDILIALGHSGYETDKRIAKEVEDIDLVIGGHTNTFLYEGTPPDSEVPEGFYPTEITQESKRKVYVVQAYAYTKYLGNFSVSFDASGEVTHIKGNPILVDSTVKQAEDVQEMIIQMKKPIDELMNITIGKTRVLLDGDSKNCRRKECNLGNLICDSIIDYYATQYLAKKGWTNAAIAIQNSGSIRTSITRARGDMINRGDIISVLPFGNVIQVATMTGEKILEMLEWSVYNLGNRTSTGNLYGAYLQFGGLQVVYDETQPQNSRVVSVQVQCADCAIPSYSELQTNATYKVLVNDFIAKGGDGFHMMEDLEIHSLGITTSDVLEQYISKHSPIHTGVEWRISYANDANDEKNNKTECPKQCPKEKKCGNHGTTYQPIGLTILLPIVSWLLAR